MTSSEYLKMNLPGYKDPADIIPIKENFEMLDEAFRDLISRVDTLERKEKSGLIYWGTSKSKYPTEAVVKSLAHAEAADEPCREIVASPAYEYLYYAVPKCANQVRFETGGQFVGGFTEPVVIEIDGDNYFVYRSDRLLSYENLKINVIR